MELKDIITKALLFKFLYIHVGVMCLFAVTALLWKIFWRQNRVLIIMCIILEIAIPVSALIACIVAIVFGYLHHDFRFWVGIILFIYCIKQLIDVIKTLRRDGWTG